MEVRASPRLRAYSHALKELFPTIKSPVFSEVLVVFSEEQVRSPPPGLGDTLREMYGIREFRVTLCLETIERTGASNLRALMSQTQAEVDKGSFNFLPSPPLVFSRTLTKYDRLRNP